MITINSFEYYGPYILEPTVRFFENMLRCNPANGELISKNLIITENKWFEPYPFPLKRSERLDLVEYYVEYFKDFSSKTCLMVDVYAWPESEEEVTKLLETDCSQRVLCLLLLTEETRFALQQVGKLDLLYCVAHLNELDNENNKLPVHLHMAFCVQEPLSEEILNTIKAITAGDFAKAKPKN